MVHASHTSDAASSVVARKRISSCSASRAESRLQSTQTQAAISTTAASVVTARYVVSVRDTARQSASGPVTSVRPMAAISHNTAATRPHQRARASSISAGATRAVPRIVPAGTASSIAAGSDDAPALGPSSTGASGVWTATADTDWLAPAAVDRAASATTTPARRRVPSDPAIGSSRASRNPSGVGTRNVAEPPARRDAGSVAGRPSHASGTPSAS